ncbi:MAG: hypothetical protein CMP59_08310 [Flavobacteriales bacterium]|nr:hypothetical protein [Flavobacteriales bacterium]|tara:strand:- start:719 stop:1462 length:744 start_codon:yes stop_codon:yes gene_type:complete
MKTSFRILGLLCLISLLWTCEHDPLVEEGPEFIPPPRPPEIPHDSTATVSDSCAGDTVYFQNTILPLLNSNCSFSACHSSENTNRPDILEKYNPRNYATIMNSDKVDIDIGDPTKSGIYEVLVDDPPDRMPRGAYGPLSAAEIESIRLWIEQGAKNNSCKDCDTSQYSFSMNILPLIQTYCQGNCHAGQLEGPFPLTNHIEISAKAGKIYTAINHTGSIYMPKNLPKLDPCYIYQVKRWIERKTPND